MRLAPTPFVLTCAVLLLLANIAMLLFGQTLRDCVILDVTFVVLIGGLDLLAKGMVKYEKWYNQTDDEQ
jgi:hypothetical protein